MQVTDLYAQTDRSNWAGGEYRSAVLKSRAFDYEIMNTCANGRNYEISLPCELVGESDLDRSIPVLIDGDTNPLKQAGAVFADGEDAGFIRFSRSNKGKKWQKSFIAGEAQIEFAPSTRRQSLLCSAFAIGTSDGT